MTLYFRAIISLALLSYLFLYYCDGAKINTPRVLLPWLNDKQVNFTFEIFEGGCYAWSLSRDDIIEIEPLYDSWGHCSRAARVYVSKSCSPPGTVIILAEEVNTGEILRGDVDIDKISTLKVVSTTWTLFLEEAPEAFEVIAYDDQGNKFSTLEGISFTWTIENIGENANEEPLVHLVRWTDTDYEAPRGIAQLEAQGLHSYTALLYGQAMGETRVSVCLTDICTDFNLHVIASVILTPAVVYIAQGDTLRYRVVRARAGRLTIENLVDTTYSLKVPAKSSIELEDSVSLIRGLNLGSTTVSLISGAMVVATAIVTVTQPHSIKVIIRPANLVVTGEYFIVQCTVYDTDGNALIAGDEMLIRLSIDGVANVELLRSTENGTLTDALAHSPGTFTVTARLHSIAGRQLSKKIESQDSGEAVTMLEVVPEELFVAWTDVTQEIKLKHRGGGAEPVEWGESEPDKSHHRALSLSHKAVLTVKGVGDIGVKVQLQNYPYVMAFGRVWSAVPEYLQIYSPGEARVGKPHYLHIALTGTHPTTAELYNFHNCDCGSLMLSHLDGPEPYDVSAATHITPLEGACCVLQVYWRVRGVSTVRGSVGRVGDTARITIRATPQLLWPKNAAALVDGTRTVIALGEALTPQSSDPKVVDIATRDGHQPYRYPDAKLFTLKCRRKGDARIELVSHTSEDRESVQFEVACATHVTKIRLEPSEPTSNCTGGPRIWLRPDKDTYIRVTLLDTVGRELLDERGTKASWEMSPKHNGIEFKSPNTLLIENHPDFVPVSVAYGFYQSVMAEQKAVGWSGTLKVSLPDATASIQARVAAPLKCEPCKVNLAWEGENTYTITTITGGSGRYLVEGHASLSPSAEDGSLLAQLPAPGTYELLVADACVPNERVTVQINIEEILSLEVQTARAVCVGACVPLATYIRGVSLARLASSRPASWRGSGHVVVEGDKACGVREGAGRLRASFRDIWSPDVEILVFPPLSIVPSVIKLPPTAKLQLRHSGGPPSHLATLQYFSVDTTQAVEVSSTGLVHGLSVGSARVRLVATDSSNFEMASAEATVEVTPVTGLKVRSATQTLLVGQPSPVWVESEGLSPRTLSAIQPAPRVTWTLRDATAARLYTTHIDDMLERSAAEGLSVRVVPLKGGVVTIDVRVRNMGQLTDTRVWENTIEILAITELKVTVEGLPIEFTPGDRLALAIGSIVRLQSSPRSTWIGQGPEGVVEISANGELKALQPGFSAVVVQSKDERNNVYRETLIHVEVSLPHYCTIQPSFESDSSALRVVLRSSVGRELLAPAANLTVSPSVAVPRVTAHSALGKELLLTVLEAPGSYLSVEATASGVTVADEVWISSADLHAHRLVAAGSWAICLSGSGWRSPSAVTLLEGNGVTLALLNQDISGKHVLRADRPSRMLTVHQVPLDKMELLAAESGQLLSVLSMTAEGVTSSPLVCTEEDRMLLEGLSIELPFSCHTTQPHTANAQFDLVNGQVGCVIIPATIITTPSEVELCAEWGLHRTCTTVHLIPPITVSPLKVSLLNPPTEFTIKGQSKALRGITMTSSPDLKIERKFKNDELTITVTNEDLTCGSGWIIVLSPLTDQEFRVEVEKECEVACGTLLGALFSLLRPYLSTLITMAGVAGASYYVLSKQSKPVPIIQPSATILTPLQRPSESRSFNRSTWSRSPYASSGPVNPVYGDASVLPDASFSPNTSRVNSNSRFL